MNPSALFQWVLAGPNEVEAVASLSDDCLCRLSGYLAQDYDENDATGRLFGICTVEASRRFERRVTGRAADQEEPS